MPKAKLEYRYGTSVHRDLRISFATLKGPNEVETLERWNGESWVPISEWRRYKRYSLYVLYAISFHLTRLGLDPECEMVLLYPPKAAQQMPEVLNRITACLLADVEVMVVSSDRPNLLHDLFTVYDKEGFDE